MKRNRKILAIFTERNYGEEEGIFRYCQDNEIVFQLIARYDLPYLVGFRPDGVIFSPDESDSENGRELFEYIGRMKIPAVKLTAFVKNLDALPVVHDFVSIGSRITENFIERKFKNFMFYGYGANPHQHSKIEKGIYDTLKGRGLDISFVELNKLYGSPLGSQLSPNSRMQRLRKTIDSFPKPLAIITPYGHLGNEVISCCLKYGILVPEQVAVASLLWSEYDSFSTIPLSGIKPDYFAKGYKAAEVLHRMMKGEKIKEPIILIPSPQFVVRASSDIIAVENIALSKALSYISRNFRSREFSMKEMVKVSGVCKVKLFQIFKEKLETTPEKELMRRRFDTAKTFLEETEWKIADVAEKSGFSTHIIFTTIFKRKFGVSPLQFRRKFRKS